MGKLSKIYQKTYLWVATAVIVIPLTAYSNQLEEKTKKNVTTEIGIIKQNLTNDYSNNGNNETIEIDNKNYLLSEDAKKEAKELKSGDYVRFTYKTQQPSNYQTYYYIEEIKALNDK